ncbi:MAG: glycine/sarcosine/betaine reductase selenoprotein B family protein [Anaerolineales bacterium]|nr:glycine/sarcosine/betaine reductase selenoprotein B family protein [Anaerolineales bacterium]
MVDSFKFLPRLMAAFYRNQQPLVEGDIPWTPLPKPLNECRLSLITTAGLYRTDLQPPFDTERELSEPTWGDPSFRPIPTNSLLELIGVSHLHVNPQPILQDLNVVFPLLRMQELVAEGIIGSFATQAFSLMGYQGFPPNPRTWLERSAPQIAADLRAESVDALILTPV